MGEKVIKNVVCCFDGEEDTWKGKIIFEKGNNFKFKGMVDNDTTYISGELKEKNINMALIHKDNNNRITDYIYSFKEDNCLNGYKYYSGLCFDYDPDKKYCHLTLGDFNSDTLDEDKKILEKRIDDFNKKGKLI